MQQPKDNRPLGELFVELSQELRTLFQQEMELFRTEISQKMTQMIKDVAAVAIGGVLLYTGFLVLIAAIVLGVAEFMPPWVAALLVAIVFLAIGVAFVQKGRKDLARMKMVPEKSTDTLKETARWAKTLK
ncbi:phage holin family protein [Geobacter sp. DSM 9736]|uniref:phage holin family protein n=1 Tax=Geobacter sp. DSM 9736 TaxID=1277350 RepID=UPI000B512E91|nr:phage holin family protein [Geobacter sp. DSM 9736]SNB46784.1 Putative Holin-X, holin superfamily III [Geobacter sp. DSM 9736]